MSVWMYFFDTCMTNIHAYIHVEWYGQAFIAFRNGHWGPVEDLELCITWPSFVMVTCSGAENTMWTFNPDTLQIETGVGTMRNRQCVSVEGKNLKLTSCDNAKDTVYWEYSTLTQ